MNQSAVVPRLDLVNGRPVTTSLNVAEVFGKQHLHVLRAIRSLDVPDEFSASNFGLASYVDAQGKPRPMYQITRDGFTLLAMGFTGKAAMQFKLAYIEAFNRMEQELASGVPGKRADIFHHRGPVSDSGLDIRYTLDLTKIILRPNRTSLELLQRLTGVDVSDLAAFAADLRPGRETNDSMRCFVDEMAVPMHGSRIRLRELHSLYTSWCEEHGIMPMQVASSRVLAGYLRDVGYAVAKRGGVIVVYGMAVQEVRA